LDSGGATLFLFLVFAFTLDCGDITPLSFVSRVFVFTLHSGDVTPLLISPSLWTAAM